MANALKWSIDLDTSGAQKSLNKVKNSLNSFGKESIGAMIAPLAGVLGAVGSVAAVMKGLSGAINLGAEMEDLSVHTGIAVDRLMMLRKSFKLAGVDAEVLGPAVGKMQKYLATAASGGSGSLLRKMGLDPKELANMKPDEAFRKIGESINALENPTARAKAAMDIFGGHGAMLFPVFDRLKDTAKIGDTAKILGENAASFKKASEALDSVGGKINGFFVGMASSFVPALLPLLEQFKSLDLSSWGQSLGNVIGNFSTNFEDEFDKIMNFVSDALEVIFSADSLVGFGLALFAIADKLGQKISLALKSPLDHAQASVEYFVKARLYNNLGVAAKMAGVKAPTYEDTLKQVQARGNVATIAASGHEAESATIASEAISRVKDTLGKLRDKLKPVITATNATNSANAVGRLMAEGDKPKNGAFDPESIGMGKQSIVADSLARIGGGGNSVGGNPILDESRRQTGLLEQIKNALNNSNAPGTFQAAQFATA